MKYAALVVENGVRIYPLNADNFDDAADELETIPDAAQYSVWLMDWYDLQALAKFFDEHGNSIHREET